ncbi:MAG: precorrin-3B C(17)-methyltransferase [Roseburia sp.]
MKNEIVLVGMGPGKEEMMTAEAIDALEKADVIVGYTVYLKLLGERFQNKEMLGTPMRQETERCRLAFGEAEKGKRVAFICSGDAGIYGMASLMYELGKEYPDIELTVLPGITAASSGAAALGAPLNHDFCVISLSDLLTPWEKIEKRLIAAAEADFAIAIYNPSSHKRKDYLMRACDILLRCVEGERACGYVENIGREGTKVVTCILKELREAEVNMFTTVFIGNSESKIVKGKLITKRGYQIERNTDLCRDNGRKKGV